MAVLVIAEHDEKTLSPATASLVAAARATGEEQVDVLVAGSSCAEVAEAASRVPGASRALVADDPAYANQLAENVAALIVEAHSQHGWTHIVAAATTSGKNLLPRVAALLDVAMISDVMEVVQADTFKRPAYAGNVIETVQNAQAVKVWSARPTSFDPCDAPAGGAVELLAGSHDLGVSRFVGQQIEQSERPDLTAAEIVVSGGRGVGSAENFQLIDSLAEALGAAVGASRAAVDAGFVSNDLQVGQTGKIVAPKLYIAVGISGAIQHLAGMKESKVIVAINKDEEAPIFQVADYGLVADLFKAAPELEKMLRESGV